MGIGCKRVTIPILQTISFSIATIHSCQYDASAFPKSNRNGRKAGIWNGLIHQCRSNNVLLDYIFVVPMNRGIAGSALGTGIGYLIQTIIGIVVFWNQLAFQWVLHQLSATILVARTMTVWKRFFGIVCCLCALFRLLFLSSQCCLAHLWFVFFHRLEHRYTKLHDKVFWFFQSAFYFADLIYLHPLHLPLCPMEKYPLSSPPCEHSSLSLLHCWYFRNILMWLEFGLLFHWLNYLRYLCHSLLS